jgi:hypothetical protein
MYRPLDEPSANDVRNPAALWQIGLCGHAMTRWIIIVVLAMIVPVEALRNALVGAFAEITNNLNQIP